MNMPDGPHCICPEHFTGKHCQRGKEMVKAGEEMLRKHGSPGPTEEVSGSPETWHDPSLS